MNKRVDALERLLESKMPEEVNRLVMMIEKNRLEFLDARDDTEKQITQIENKITSVDSKQQPPPEA
jgi:hypothetical protein